MTAEFVSKCSVKMQELNKKTGGGGGGSGGGEDKHCGELLDNRCFMKLVEVAHGLLKMAPYDLDCIKLPGLQESSVCYHWSEIKIIQMYTFVFTGLN